MRSNRSIKTVLFSFGAIFFLALFYISGIRNSFVGVFNNILAPVISPALETISAQEEKAKLFEEENNTLRQENLELKDKLAVTQTLLKDKDALSQYKADKKILTKILWYNIMPGNRVVHINKGRNDQIKENMAVVSAGGMLVGKTINVLDNSADVLLIDDPRFTISVQVQGITGLLNSNPDGATYISLVGVDDNVETGAEVRTAGQGDGLPQNLLVGRVSEASINGAEPFLNIKVLPLVDIKKQEYIFVIDVNN